MNYHLFLTICIFLTMPHSLKGKRHSRTNKVERFEQRALQAAQAHSPLEKALKKQTKAMNFSEALLAQDYYRSVRELDMVIKCGERLLALGGEQDALRGIRLELAELFLKKSRYPEAEKHAQDYLLYYPGAPESKKAAYIALQSCYLSQSNSHNDQQKTRETLRLAQEYQDRYPQDTEFMGEVMALKDNSYLKLVRSELNIIETQLSLFINAGIKSALSAAQKRCALLKEKYLPHVPSVHNRIKELEQKLAQAAGNNEPLRVIQAENRSRYERLKDFFIEDSVRYFA